MKFALLKEFFAGFLRTRHFARHFRRLAMLDSMTDATVSREVPPTLAQTLTLGASGKVPELLSRLGSNLDGLSEDEALALRQQHGLNEVEHEQPLPWWVHLWHCYKNPFNLLLTLLALISWLTEDMKAATVIFSMVVLSTLLRFWQEARSNQAADALKAMVSNTATVLRREDGKAQRIELPIKQLVPGDLIVLSAGDMIPADCRVLSAKDLFVSQAAMTGESLPVEKFARRQEVDTGNPLDLENILFMGTNVVSGAATGVVLTTGNNTYFGALAQRVSATDRAPTSFQAGVNKVSWLLIRFMFVMAPLVLFINGFTKGDWMEALLFALSIAVGLTPEMLPMIVTSTLAKGAVFLSRKKVIVKRLDAIQNFGAMDVLCTDKTGTLTQDKIFLARHVDVWGDESDDVLEMAYLNSYYQTGLKNLLDVAVLEHVEIHRELQVGTAFSKVDEVPFDFNRRRMSVVVQEHGQPHLLICKGALEEVLGVCNRVRHGEEEESLTPELLERIVQVTAGFNEEGLRVVAVAARSMDAGRDAYGLADESDLTLIGYVAFLDPPKESTAPALKALAEHGVAVKVLTGDNERVTAKICREVGLERQGLLLGGDVERMSDAELAVAVETTNVFAKLTPSHKERIVRLLKANGHVVGFMGDGINDAPALRTADIGISVDSAVDIAKEAADIILLEKSLMVLEEGVLEGRRTFANML
ncbi:magnesium-translocating P-type ATPase, partial [Pseudomonas sp. NPDC088444]